MKDEAEANADADKKTKEEVEKVNQADSMIFQTEKQLKEYGEKLSEGNKTNIEKALGELKEAHKNKDLPAMDAATSALNTAWQGASEEMYKDTEGAKAEGDSSGNQESGEAEGSPDASGENDVTDVDFEEVKEDK